MDSLVQSVTYFELVLRLANRDQSIGLQRSVLDCFLVKEDAVVLLEAYHHHCHLVMLEDVDVLEVEVVEEVILNLLDSLSRSE